MEFSITNIILIGTGIISFLCFSNLELKSKLMFNPYSVKHKNEWYRFISHGFIHGDMNHLLINMFVLWQFGNFIEKAFVRIFGSTSSTLVFVFFYIAAIIASSMSSYMRHKDNPNYNSLGASGATSAMIFAFVIFDPWQWFIFPPLPALILAVGYLYYSSYMDARQSDNIGHNAHFWGAVFGFVFVMGSIVALNPGAMFADTEATTMLGEIWERLSAGPGMPGFLGGRG